MEAHAMNAKMLTGFLLDMRIVSYAQAGSIAILVFDSFLTFDQEIRAVWSQKWNHIRILYVLTRYSAFLEAGLTIYELTIPAEENPKCLFPVLTNALLVVFGLGVGEIIMTIQTWVAWSQNRTLTYALPIFFIFFWVGGFATVGIFVRGLRFKTIGILADIPDIGCFPTRYDRTIRLSMALLFLYDTVMLILMAIAALRIYRSRGRLASHLLEIIHRDGVLYYFYLFVLSMANTIVAVTKFPTPLGFGLVTVITLFSRIIHTILACRVVLHIHECRHTIQGLPS